MPTYERVVAQQRRVHSHLDTLLRLGDMQLQASTPEAWEAVLACKDKEISALTELDLAAAMCEAQQFLSSSTTEPPSALADLLALNTETLRRVGELESKALARAAAQTEALRTEMTAARRNTRLSAAYARATAPRFLDRTR
jgi:hypothetical protein